MIKIITQEVSIESKYLDSDIKDHILNKLKKIMEGKCTLINGYVIEVNKVISLGENIIGCANSFTIFKVTYEAEVLLPEKGQFMNGKVCMVFQHGIFVEVCSKMKVLIPVASMEEFKYSSVNNSFENKDCKIVNGMYIDIEIIMTKYEKKQFSCIGILSKPDYDDILKA
jgi:DNA-directed RNA polymerase subunit E'/Rpb7